VRHGPAICPGTRPHAAMTRRGTDAKATSALIGAVICWSAVPLMLRYLAVRGIVPDGWTSNAVRYPVSALLYTPWLIPAIRDRSLRRLWLLALIPTIPNLAGQTCWAWAPYYIDAGLTTFIVRLSVVWTMVGAVIFFPDERALLRSPLFWIGTAMNVAGFLAIVLYSHSLAAGATKIGVLISVGCSVFWALYIIGVRKAMGRVNPLTAFAVVSLYTSVAFLAMAPLGEPSLLLRMTVSQWALLLFSAVVGIAAAHGMYYIAVQRLGAMIPSTVNTIAPFLTAAASSLWFGEVIRAEQWVGGLIAAVGSGLVIWSQRSLAAAVPIEPAVD
jgi:drug/metabolite transporter (DMT)-like permease